VDACMVCWCGKNCEGYVGRILFNLLLRGLGGGQMGWAGRFSLIVLTYECVFFFFEPLGVAMYASTIRWDGIHVCVCIAVS